MLKMIDVENVISRQKLSDALPVPVHAPALHRQITHIKINTTIKQLSYSYVPTYWVPYWGTTSKVK